MNKIPFYIIEEHHEAFLIWHYAIIKGLINKNRNTLLHIDEHSDMLLPLLRTSLNSVDKSLHKVYDFTYNELSIENFIYPAIYQGIFDDLYWLRQTHNKKTTVKKEMNICSQDGQGKQLIIQSRKNAHRLLNLDDQSFSVAFITTGDSLLNEALKPANQSVILDIDIDYFSCDNASGGYFNIEITPEAYYDYINNFYNKARLAISGTALVQQVDGKYYLCSRLKDDLLSENLKVPEEIIIERIDALINFLKVNQIQPQLIDICRSRLSGYTPNDQWEFIENRLIEKLSEIYEFNPVFLGDLSKEDLAVA